MNSIAILSSSFSEKRLKNVEKAKIRDKMDPYDS